MKSRKGKVRSPRRRRNQKNELLYTMIGERDDDKVRKDNAIGTAISAPVSNKSA